MLRQDQKITIGRIMDLYIEDRRIEGKKAGKMQVQWNQMQATFGHLQPEDVAAKMIVKDKPRTICHKYALDRAQVGRARDTIHSELSLLRTAINWAANHNHISMTPHVWVPPAGKRRETAMTGDEIGAILVQLFRAPWHIRLTILIGMATGARKEAILELPWSQVDLDRRVIDFRRRGERDILDTGHIKGRAVVDMSDELHEALTEAHEWRTPECPTVIEYHGKPVKDVKKAIQGLFRRAGVYRRFVGLHALRHTLATWAHARGIPVERIQAMLGHADKQTTVEAYIQHQPGALADVAGVVSEYLLEGTGKRAGTKDQKQKIEPKNLI